MSTNHTTNYNLNQWEATDKVLRTEFNEDNAKIDAALAGLAGTAAEHTAAIAGLGNCRIERFSYTGTGTYGSGNPTKITFAKRPLLFFILGQNAFFMGSRLAEKATIIKFASYGATVRSPILTWSGNQVSFYDVDEAFGQMNHSGSTYWVFALYAEDEV